MTKPIKHNNCSTGCHGSCCLKVQDLTVIRGDDTILDHVNFHMHCGELIALIGPNGAGKSSLFKSILGQMSGASGSISFQTATGEHLKPRIGYVPQSPSFDPGDPVSVLDLFVTAISRWPVFLPTPAKLRSKVLECLKRVNAETLIDKRVGALSGGEVQRVLLAMALELKANAADLADCEVQAIRLGGGSASIINGSDLSGSSCPGTEKPESVISGSYIHLCQ